MSHLFLREVGFIKGTIYIPMAMEVHDAPSRRDMNRFIRSVFVICTIGD